MGIKGTVIKYLFGAFLVSSVKSLPLAYFVRFYYLVIANLALEEHKFRRNGGKNTFGYTSKNGAKKVFEYVTLSSYVSPLEIDMYFHKSNSTYFTDLDIARTKLIVRVFQSTFLNYYNNTKGEFKRSKRIGNVPYAPVATVQCSFKREFKLFERFQVKSRVFAWDRKWLFVLSKFVVVKGGVEKVYALAMTKYVFKKNGRITISPEEMIREADLWSEEIEAENKENYELVKGMVSSEELEAIACRV